MEGGVLLDGQGRWSRNGQAKEAEIVVRNWPGKEGKGLGRGNMELAKRQQRGRGVPETQKGMTRKMMGWKWKNGEKRNAISHIYGATKVLVKVMQVCQNKIPAFSFNI
jgi:hypothetical protein